MSQAVNMLFLLGSEHNILAQYEENLKFEEASLCAAIECLRTDDVICPVCKRWVASVTVFTYKLKSPTWASIRPSSRQHRRSSRQKTPGPLAC